MNIVKVLLGDGLMNNLVRLLAAGFERGLSYFVKAIGKNGFWPHDLFFLRIRLLNRQRSISICSIYSKSLLLNME